jgi:hypothetical protein
VRVFWRAGGDASSGDRGSRREECPVWRDAGSIPGTASPGARGEIELIGNASSPYAADPVSVVLRRYRPGGAGSLVTTSLAGGGLIVIGAS